MTDTFAFVLIKEKGFKGNFEVHLSKKRQKKEYHNGSVYSSTRLSANTLGVGSFDSLGSSSRSFDSSRTISVSEKSSEEGSGAALVHARHRGDRHPTRSWELFKVKLERAMDDLNDPVRSKEIAEEYKKAR